MESDPRQRTPALALATDGGAGAHAVAARDASGAAAAASRVKVTEIFHSIQGEALYSGLPSVFIRLTGCPLRCRYCDTAYAFTGGKWWSIDEIAARVERYRTRYVCVTGGEPLAQPRCRELLATLCDAGYEVCVETGGAMDVSDVDARVARIVDVKTPASGEHARNRWSNLDALTSRDAVKLVICDRGDYEWGRAFVGDRGATLPCPVFFSPSHDELDPGELADWILEDGLPVRLQVQLHKTLWGDVPGR